jgi:hypothetical protein
MNQKKGPFVLLGVLFVLLVFIVGVKYGKQVEKADKTISFVLSITPTRPPEPTKPIGYSTFLNKGCGVQFLYPDTLKVEKNASAEASLVEGKAEAVQISCAKENPIQAMLLSPDTKLATQEAKLKTQTIKTRTQTGTVYFQIKNPQNGKQVYVAIDSHFYPLFESTLQFSR